MQSHLNCTKSIIFYLFCYLKEYYIHNILFHYDYNNFQCKLSRFLATHFIDFDICWHSPHSFLFQWKSINACLREYHAFVPSLKICQSYLKYFNFVNKKTVHISKLSTFISLASSQKIISMLEVIFIRIFISLGHDIFLCVL